MFDQSKWFYDEFRSTFSSNHPLRQTAIDAYTKNTSYTSFITQRINEIIASKHYNYQNEYYRIDAIGYTPRWTELDENQMLCGHLWDLEIAVEHENDAKDWLDEVIKLAHICCPLRVVIGYVPVEQRTHGDEERLMYASTAFQKLKCKNNITSGEFLIILGNSNTNGNVSDYFNYKGYVLNTQTMTFENLDNYRF